MRRSEGTSLDIEMNPMKQEEVLEVSDEEEQSYVMIMEMTNSSVTTVAQSVDTIAVVRSMTARSLMLTSMDIQENKDIVALDSCHYSNPHYYESDDDLSVVDAEHEAMKQELKRKEQLDEALNSEIVSPPSMSPGDHLSKKEVTDVNTKMMGIWGISRMKHPESSGEEGYTTSVHSNSTTQSESDSLPNKSSFHSFNKYSIDIF